MLVLVFTASLTTLMSLSVNISYLMYLLWFFFLLRKDTEEISGFSLYAEKEMI